MELDAFQALSRRTLNPALSPRDRLLDAGAGLCEEAGEVLGLLRKHLLQQHPLDRAAITRELGDTLWCLCAVASALDLSLGEVAAANLEKLRRRYPDGFSTEASQQRGDAEGGASAGG